jgi:hypothetical protein
VFQFFEDAMKQNPGISSRVTSAQTVDDLVAFVDSVAGADGSV